MMNTQKLIDNCFNVIDLRIVLPNELKGLLIEDNLSKEHIHKL